jgi:hypothetical protein
MLPDRARRGSGPQSASQPHPIVGLAGGSVPASCGDFVPTSANFVPER